MAEEYEFRRLRAIFDGDGSEIREQFLYAGLLLTIFERFKDYIVDHVDEFFSHEFQIKDGSVKYTRSEEFKKLVKEKGSGVPGQHANKEFRAALYWFYDLGAITKHEFDEIERVYALRNEIGHELFRIIADDCKNPIKLGDVIITYAVYLKTVRWWVKEVEATIDPDFDQEKYDNTNWDATESTDTLFLREIMHKALLGNAAFEQLEELIRAEQAASGASTQPSTTAPDTASTPKSG